MGRGTHRGFITYDELSKSLGKRNLSDENLAQAFIHILDEKIVLVEKKSDFKVLRKKENSNKEEGKTIEKSDDPIRMYLREMGGVELLSREGEIAIAKRIEAGKDVMLIALSQSPITAQQFFEWNEQLQKEEILVREIIDIDTNYMEDETTGPSAKQKNSGETDKEEGSSDEDDDFNPTLAAMETEIRPKVLKTVNTLTKEYSKLIKYQKEKLDCILNSQAFSTAKERGYEKIVNGILENIKSLQLSPSVLEELVQKHYIENKKIISLEGNLLRYAMDHKIPRNEFIKFYVGNEINPNLKKFLDTNFVWKQFFSKYKEEFKNIRERLVEISNKLGISVTDYKKLVSRIQKGNLMGVIAQFGGQTPIKLAKFLHDNKLPILGTQYTSIDLAEDRDRFRNLLNKLKLKQAESGIAKTFNQAIKIADKIGLPLMVRPSYVLGGRAMEIVHEKNQLKKFVEEAFKAAEENPILIDKFIDHAMEVDVDAISDGKQVHVAGIMQHIEEAGIHSGDSACSLPPVSIKPYLLKEIENQTKKLAIALNVKGFMNIQFAIKKDEIYVIEVNPRASRTVPFVSKAKGLPLAKIASRVMAGEKLSKFNLKDKSKGMYAVKEAVFPFNKFPNSDLLLGPEMKSTGEVMGFDKNFGMAFAKSQIAAANSLPKQGLAFISLKDSHKDEGIDLAKELLKLKFTLCATRGTAEYIRKHGMKCKIINKVSTGTPHIVDVLDSKKIALVINTGGGNSEHRLSDAIALRRATLKNKVPYCTNMSTAQACLEAIRSLKTKKLEVTSLQDV